jgi:predicted ATPase
LDLREQQYSLEFLSSKAIMISKWTLARFKSAYDETTLQMSPLVVFAGTNNSGKSTVLQSILLTAQSLQSPVSNRPITLNGHLVRLGTFDDILATGSVPKTIKLGFTLSELVSQNPRFSDLSDQNSIGPIYWGRSPEKMSNIACDFEFSPTGSGERAEILQLQPSVNSCRVEVEYQGQTSDERKKDSVEAVRLTADIKGRLEALRLKQIRPEELRALEYTVKSPRTPPQRAFYSLRSPSEVVGAVMYHFLPRALLARYDEVEESVKQIIAFFVTPFEYSYSPYIENEEAFGRIPEEFKDRVIAICKKALGAPDRGFRQLAIRRAAEALQKLIQDFSPENYKSFIRSVSTSERTDLFKKMTEEVGKLEQILRGGREADYRTRIIPLSDESDFAHSYLVEYFQHYLKYLAPLRDEPKPVYPLTGMSDPTDVGFKGEHTAAVLETNKHRPIEFISPEAFSSPLGSMNRTTESLQDAVLSWMRYLGVVTGVYSSDLGKLGHDLRVSTNGGNLRDLTHVGVGVSQVLPIVVLALLSPAGSTLIFEQPELHLHPRVQSRLADFFLSMTLLSKQCIVETHSEHIISRLRQRVADAASDQVANAITIYFVEAPEGKSQYRKISINNYGSISEWPQGFFDEGEELAAAILKANLGKRQAK